jgi:hypothetical protein
LVSANASGGHASKSSVNAPPLVARHVEASVARSPHPPLFRSSPAVALIRDPSPSKAPGTSSLDAVLPSRLRAPLVLSVAECARRTLALPIAMQVVRWLAGGQDGRRTQAQLPGRATALPTQLVLDQQTKPVILVGHSYGGAVVSDG